MTKKTQETILGAAMIAFGAAYLALAFRIERRDVIDATFVPFILSGALLILGTVQILTTFFGKAGSADAKKAAAEKAEDACAGEPVGVDTATVLKTIGLIVVYLLLMGVVGFTVTSALYLFAQFIVLTPEHKKKNYLVYGIISAVSAVSIFLIFRYVFSLMLPAGFLI